MQINQSILEETEQRMDELEQLLPPRRKRRPARKKPAKKAAKKRPKRIDPGPPTEFESEVAAVPPEQDVAPTTGAAPDQAEFDPELEAMVDEFPAEAFVDPPADVQPDLSDPEIAAARRQHLAFGGNEPTDLERERIMGKNDLVDGFYLQRALVAAQPVCRIVLRSQAGREIGYATGFKISPNLLMTNWHVFPNRDDARNAVAEFGYTLDICGNPAPSDRFLLRPDQFFESRRELDMAIVAIDPEGIGVNRALAHYGFHRLVEAVHKIEEGEWVTIIQHPGGERRQFAIRENKLHSKPRNQHVLWYYSDTAQGSSGAPAFNDSFQVVALHSSGRARRAADGKYLLKTGKAVDSLKGLEDHEVDWEANEGIRISRICHFINQLDNGDDLVAELHESMKGGDIMSKTLSGTVEPSHFETANGGGGSIRIPAAPGGTGSTVSVNVGQVVVHNMIVEAPGGVAATTPAAPRPPTPPPAAAPGSSAAPGHVEAGLAGAEKALLPPIDPVYSNRRGYSKFFLGRKDEVVVELPKVDDESVLSYLEPGRFELEYEHFSIFLHRHRRLALFCASNLDGRPHKRAPEAGYKYTRRALGGLGEHDTEAWKVDPRVPAWHQLPDKFYIRDRKAFDRGHLVRRDDVTWGSSYDQVEKANADTFHVTNCSPQVGNFNQSRLRGIWGKLENTILKQAEKKDERYSVFCGPVFYDDDPWFEGVDDNGTVRVQIPQEYWKVVVWREGDSLKSAAYVLEQDLSPVDFGIEQEGFQVKEEWLGHLVRVSELQEHLGSITFDPKVVDADVYEDVQEEHENGEEESAMATVPARPEPLSRRRDRRHPVDPEDEPEDKPEDEAGGQAGA